jgi:hypothetical protein
MAVNKFGDALASGRSTYESDDDPELVASAVPFGLKLMESLLAESPKHPGLLLAASSGFTEYAYAFVGQQADRNPGRKPGTLRRHAGARAEDVPAGPQLRLAGAGGTVSGLRRRARK